MAAITKTSIANVVAGIAVVSGILKGFVITGEFGELEIMIVGTALGYLFGAASTTARSSRSATGGASNVQP